MQNLTTSKLHWFFSHRTNPLILSLDLVLYLGVMFLIREVYFEQVNFITNGLFWAFSILITAVLLMRVRGVTWQELGLRKPNNIKKYGVCYAIYLFVYCYFYCYL